MIIFLILDLSAPLEAQEEKSNSKSSIINKFCIATLRSKLSTKDKEKLNEISDFTCKCFFKKYNAGNSLKRSRIYCRDKASEKYNL